jgi:zinc protease
MPAILRYTLDNGLRVLVAPDPAVPMSAVAVHYDVGFRSEPEGHSGFAHLFEHLMFQGSTSLAKLEHVRRIQGAGGVFHGGTHPDHTEFCNLVPAGAVDMALFLEADRMRAPRFTDENLRTQIDVVKQEIRQNVHEEPYGGLPWISVPPLLYSTFANSHNGYGAFDELDEATLDDCAEFFDAHYAPANAVLTVAGNVDPARVEDLVARHFGDIPRRPTPGRQTFAELPLPAERRGHRVDRHAPLPAVAVGYRVPDPGSEQENYLAHAVLCGVLSDGDSSRLHRRLVHKEALAHEVDACVGLFDVFDARDPDTLLLTAIHNSDVTAGEVLDAIDDELAAVAAEPPSIDELSAVAARWRTSLYHEFDQLLSRALALGSFELLYGEPDLLHELPARIGMLSPELVAVAADGLRRQHRAVLVVEAGGAES